MSAIKLVVLSGARYLQIGGVRGIEESLIKIKSFSVMLSFIISDSVPPCQQ